MSRVPADSTPARPVRPRCARIAPTWDGSWVLEIRNPIVGHRPRCGSHRHGGNFWPDAQRDGIRESGLGQWEHSQGGAEGCQAADQAEARPHGFAPVDGGEGSCASPSTADRSSLDNDVRGGSDGAFAAVARCHVPGVLGGIRPFGVGSPACCSRAIRGYHSGSAFDRGWGRRRAELSMTWDDAWEPTPELVAAVLDVVATIPLGRVMAYGDVAGAIGPHPDIGDAAAPFAARKIGRVMQHFGRDAAWWRVIRSTGQPPRFLEARAWPYYVEERTPVIGTEGDYRIDLKRARFVSGGEASSQASLFDLS